MNFSILLFSFECGASNAANLNIVAFFISVLQLFPYKKYIYTSIEYFLRFFVSYLTIYIYISKNIKIISIIFSFPFDPTIPDKNVRAAVVPSERNHLHEQRGTERRWNEMRREKGSSFPIYPVNLDLHF